jgi:ABC-type phosphate transport system permease subunit
MIKGFVFVCSILAIVYLINVVVVIINICNKKRSRKSIAQINPYKFFIKVFWNRNDGFGTDRKVGIVPIVCTIMTFIGLCSILSNIIS